jgi:hypothetical protein
MAKQNNIDNQEGINSENYFWKLFCTPLLFKNITIKEHRITIFASLIIRTEKIISPTEGKTCRNSIIEGGAEDDTWI